MSEEEIAIGLRQAAQAFRAPFWCEHGPAIAAGFEHLADWIAEIGSCKAERRAWELTRMG